MLTNKFYIPCFTMFHHILSMFSPAFSGPKTRPTPSPPVPHPPWLGWRRAAPASRWWAPARRASSARPRRRLPGGRWSPGPNRTCRKKGRRNQFYDPLVNVNYGELPFSSFWKGYWYSGWWYTYPSWKMMEFVNGKDYPIYEMEKTMFQTTNQPINQWYGIKWWHDW